MRIIRIAAFTAVAVAPMAAQAQTPLQQEQAVWQAFKDKKADSFKSMFAPNYVGLYEEGTYNVAKELQNLRNAKISSVKLDSFASRMIDPNDMLMTYVADVKGSMGKQDISGRYNSASIWHRSGSKWLGVFHTEIKAK